MLHPIWGRQNVTCPERHVLLVRRWPHCSPFPERGLTLRGVYFLSRFHPCAQRFEKATSATSFSQTSYSQPTHCRHPSLCSLPTVLRYTNLSSFIDIMDGPQVPAFPGFYFLGSGVVVDIVKTRKNPCN